MSNPFLIFGLGNPGARYADTRHNAGVWFVDALAGDAGVAFRRQSRLHAETARASLFGVECLLVRPTTFMNHSGQAVRAVTDYYRADVSRILIAYDELDLPPGTARFKRGGGHGGHNGMRDIFRHMQNHDFLRLRIGIGHPGSRDAVTPWVLSRPGAEDERLIRESIAAAIEALPQVLKGDIAGAMKALHTERKDGL